MPARAPLVTYLATATLSRIATEASGPALLLAAVALLDSATAGSYLVAGLTGAAAIAGPVVGALLDRARHPRRGFTLAMGLFAAGLLLIGALLTHVPLPLLVVLALITGLAYPALTGAWTAQLPPLVTSEQLPRAYSADAGTYSAAAIVGAPLASALIVVSDLAPLWVPAVALVIAAAVLRLVPLRPRPTAPSHSILGDLKRGVATIVHRPTLRQAFIITTVSFIGQAAVYVTAPLVAKHHTGSLAMTGVLLGAIAVGGVLSSMWLVRRPIRRADRTVVLATLACGVGMLVTGLAPTFAIAIVGAFVLGVFEAPQMSATFLIRNRESATDVRAQVFTTAASLRITSFAIGSAMFGAMLGLGTVWALTIGAALHIVAVVIGVGYGARSLRSPA